LKTLILYCHPDHHASRLNRALRAAVEPLADVTVNDLYHHYPHGFVDVKREQALLLAHDVIVMQFPVFWYSTPPMLKAWQDDVLEYGFAYGSDGTQLGGKQLLLAVTAGGGPQDYHPDKGQFTLAELLRPLESTACLCKMTHRGIFHIGPSGGLDSAAVAQHATQYRKLIEAMTRGDWPAEHQTLERDASLRAVADATPARPPVPDVKLSRVGN
jgi:glutathione-regulated potassium-efflux system ancillary protein KefG